MSPPCPCGHRTAALLLLGLLLLAAAPRPATANARRMLSSAGNPLAVTTKAADADAELAPAPGPDAGFANGSLVYRDGDGQLVAPLAYSDDEYGEPLMTPQSIELAGREIYFEVPKNALGLFIFFHGCYHNGYDFWPNQEQCDWCRGLPEEVSHTKQALSLGYAFAAMNSLDRREEGTDIKCFSWETDSDTAVEALRQLPSELGLEGLPIFAGGVSSGASFAVRIPSKAPGLLAGLVSESLAVEPANTDYNWGDWPPTAFISMARDTTTGERIARNQQVLLDADVPAQTINVYDRIIYPTFFSDQSAEISTDLSIRTVEALKEIGVLGEDGWLNDDPRLGFQGLNWRGELAQRVPELDGSDPANSLTADSSDVSELLNVAWANHEIEGDYTTAVLRWWESQGKTDLNQLAAELVIRKPALLSPERLLPGAKPATAGDPPLPYARRRSAS